MLLWCLDDGCDRPPEAVEVDVRCAGAEIDHQRSVEKGRSFKDAEAVDHQVSVDVAVKGCEGGIDHQSSRYEVKG